MVGASNDHEGAIGEPDRVMKSHAAIASGVGHQIARERHRFGGAVGTG